MTTTALLLIVLGAIALLLLLVLWLKINAFVSLLIVSIATGIASGLSPQEVLKSVQDGMGGILGFVAIIVGLGAIFGQILEDSGGARSLAKYLLKKFGQDKAPWALMIAGFIISIPVFLDVGFIILVPMVYALAKKSGRSLLFYAVPLLAGMGVTHSFIPPTPGPVAVAEIIGVGLGWVIIFGFIIGVPAAIIAGPIFGKYISKKIHLGLPAHIDINDDDEDEETPSFGLVALLIGLPLLLILVSTSMGVMVDKGMISAGPIFTVVEFLGHPFVALIIAVLLSLYLLGTRRGFSKDKLLELTTKALGPAGIIILITGAGGVFKQVLIDSGVGDAIASGMSGMSMSPLILAYILAMAIRVTQGSATVAMITAAGIMAPIIALMDYSDPFKALVVITIAAGATTLSHVNDSGFWLVSKYLGMTEKETLRSWTMVETLISVVGFALALIISFFIKA